MSMSSTNEQVLSRDSTSEEVARVVEHVHGKYQQMCEELSGTIVGMKDVTEQLMIGILCRGHCILQGMPGLAKTLLISQLASADGLVVSSHSVHARFDAGRHHGRRRAGRGPHDRQASVPIPARDRCSRI